MTSLTQKTPWHLWAVGVVAILWNAVGCFDYFMTMTKGDVYMAAAGMTEAQIAFMNHSPAWMTAVWAIGVWGGLLGGVLLLLRNKLAVPVFIVSLASYVLSLIHNLVISPMPDASEQFVMFVIIFAGCVFFMWYSMRAKNNGLLR